MVAWARRDFFHRTLYVWGLLRHSDSSVVVQSLEGQLVRIHRDIGVPLEPFIILKKKNPCSGGFHYWFHTADQVHSARPGQSTALTYHSRHIAATKADKTSFLLPTQLFRSGEDSRSLIYAGIFLVTRWDLHEGIMPRRMGDQRGVSSLCWHEQRQEFQKHKFVWGDKKCKQIPLALLNKVLGFKNIY